MADLESIWRTADRYEAERVEQNPTELTTAPQLYFFSSTKGVLFWSRVMSLHTPAGLVSGLKWAQAPHWFCVAPEASTPCQFLSIHSTLSSVSLIGSPPISKIPQPHRNWLPFSHPANAIVQVHSVSLWMRWSLTHEFWDKRPMGCLSTSLLNRSYISANNNHNALKKKSLSSSHYPSAFFGKR